MNQTYIQRLKAIAHTAARSPFIRFLQRHKRTLAGLVILTFFAFIGYYLAGHPEVAQSILHIGYAKTLVIVVLYGGVLLTNVGIMYATIRLCQKQLPIKRGLLLMIYSSVINFFGPLQSGPGVRAVYLKRKTGLRIRDYTYAMLFYYFSFAAINASLLFINTAPWLSLLGVVAAIGLTVVGTKKFAPGSLKQYVFYIFMLTVLQIVLMIFIYFVELTAVNAIAHYSLMQAAAYAASANLALFVSLTPGAIGIREAFLIFSQSLHAIPLGSIVAAGIVDRAVYIVFLVGLFLLSTGLHLKDMFIGKKPL